ncbi:MAG TPA: helix-turn-helix domain-containing protein [Gemmatimonadales bacterium]|nr:helix-turn-helix domain-containing protein [Gemmatimonadales bacterium]
MDELVRFGFTQTESRVYVALLRVSPATGYTVAREAALARANTYGALETMAARGVVTRLPGSPARWVAEDPDALMGRLGHESQRRLERLAQQLSAVERRGAQAARANVELLGDRSAVLDRVRACALSARDELLAVVGPWVSEVYADLGQVRHAHAAERLLSLGSPAPAGALVRSVPPGEIESYWGGLPIAIVADRRRAVCALENRSGTTGVATNHPAVVPFVRHLLRRELASAAAQGRS